MDELIHIEIPLKDYIADKLRDLPMRQAARAEKRKQMRERSSVPKPQQRTIWEAVLGSAEQESLFGEDENA